MKKVILLALIMPFSAYGQIVENFESGLLNNWVLSTEGRWKADAESAISGIYSLHHAFDNPDAGTDRIGLPVRNLHPPEGLTRWSFTIRHGYDPSSSNNWALFLMSDREPAVTSPDGITNGFALGVNLTGYDDTLRLVKVEGTTLTKVVNCKINWQSDIGIADPVKIIVERSAEGGWKVSVFRMNGISFGSWNGYDNELFSLDWFVVYYRYSSSRDLLLWVDDINIDGVFYEDHNAPVVTSCVASGKRLAEITFNEMPADEVLVIDNFSVNTPDNKAVSIEKLSSLTYSVGFAKELINKSLNNLIINKLCDNSGNCSEIVNCQFTPVWAVAGDIVITEIMADPVPEVSLPGREYLEITNRTVYSFNLINWKLKTADQSYTIPETIIQPGGIHILCLSADEYLFAGFGKVTGLKQFPLLTDGGRIICLTDSSDLLIHGVEYSPDWYGDELKSGGGWSLEMIDVNFPFFDKGNWSASASRKGGTPGSVNSVRTNNPDRSFSGIQNVFPVDSANILIDFSEPVTNLPGNIRSIMSGGKNIAALLPSEPLFRSFIVKPAEVLERKKIYQLKISDTITDFAGMQIERKVFSFGLPEPAEKGDILFNELLFNPLPGDADYIEFYNNSENVIDASRLIIVAVNDQLGDTSQGFPVSGEKRCILPGSYFAVTTARDKVADRYLFSDNDYLFEVGSLPSMNDDKGHLILLNRELDRIDEVYYDEKMHYSLLSINEGVALEKINPGLKSEEMQNWHSAAGSSGWGTPGAPNSLLTEEPVASDVMRFSSSKITPDNDGLEDFLVIKFSLKGNGNVISASVFDETGSFVKKIASNLLAAPETSLLWDGTADDGTPVRTGIYIIYITLFDDTGKTDKWKKVCTVIR